MKRLPQILTLALLAPLVGEYLLGSTPLDKAPALLVEAPLYGGAALLIREAARRLGRGWPMIFTLALAYGVVEEGLVTQSLFNRGYAHIPDLLNYGHGVVWAIFVLSLHTVWSIATPIALTELIFPAHRHEPWLTGRLATLVGVAATLSALLLRIGTDHAYPGFHATGTQVLGTLVAAAVLVAVAHSLPRTTRTDEPVPAPGVVLATGLGIATAYLVVRTLAPRHVHAPWGLPVLLDALLLAALLATLARWSRSRYWGLSHTLAVTATALVSYAWFGYQVVPHTPLDLAGQTLAVVATGAGLVALARRPRREPDNTGVLPAATAGKPTA